MDYNTSECTKEESAMKLGDDYYKSMYNNEENN